MSTATKDSFNIKSLNEQDKSNIDQTIHKDRSQEGKKNIPKAKRRKNKQAKKGKKESRLTENNSEEDSEVDPEEVSEEDLNNYTYSDENISEYKPVDLGTQNSLVKESYRNLDQTRNNRLRQSSNSNEREHPLSLRLDLNLDVEIELKAKVHGDVTLSLLQ